MFKRPIIYILISIYYNNEYNRLGVTMCIYSYKAGSSVFRLYWEYDIIIQSVNTKFTIIGTQVKLNFDFADLTERWFSI